MIITQIANKGMQEKQNLQLEAQYCFTVKANSILVRTSGPRDVSTSQRFVSKD